MREYDIYLNNRLTECDLIVYNITFRDGLTAFNRMILNCCLDYYQIHNFVAAQSGLALDSHVEHMIGLISSKLAESGIEIDSDVRMSSKVFSGGESSVQLTQSQVETLALASEKVHEAFQIVSSKIEATKYSPLWGVDAKVYLGSEVDKTKKQSYESAEDGLHITASIQESATVPAGAESSMVLADSVSTLSYQMSASAESAFTVASVVVDMMLKHSLGGVDDGFMLGLEVNEDSDAVVKYLELDAAIALLDELTETAIKYMEPQESIMEIRTSATFKAIRYNRLKDLDQGSLGFYGADELSELLYTVF